MADASEIEITLFRCNEVNLFKLPPRPSAGGRWLSGEWQMKDKIFTGRLRVVEQGPKLEIRLEDTARRAATARSGAASRNRELLRLWLPPAHCLPPPPTTSLRAPDRRAPPPPVPAQRRALWPCAGAARPGGRRRRPRRRQQPQFCAAPGGCRVQAPRVCGAQLHRQGARLRLQRGPGAPPPPPPREGGPGQRFEGRGVVGGGASCGWWGGLGQAAPPNGGVWTGRWHGWWR